MSARKFVTGVTGATGGSGAITYATLLHLTWNTRNLSRIPNWQTLLERDFQLVMPIGQIVELIEVRHTTLGYRHYILRFGGRFHVHFHQINPITRFGVFGLDVQLRTMSAEDDWHVIATSRVDQNFRERYFLCAYFNGYSIANYNCQNAAFFCMNRAWASDQTINRVTLRRWYRNDVPRDLIPPPVIATNLRPPNSICVVMNNRLTMLLLQHLTPENYWPGQEYVNLSFNHGGHPIYLQSTPIYDFSVQQDGPLLSYLRLVYVDNLRRHVHSVSGFIIVTDNGEVDNIRRWVMELALINGIPVCHYHYGESQVQLIAIARARNDSVVFRRDLEATGQRISDTITEGVQEIRLDEAAVAVPSMTLLVPE